MFRPARLTPEQLENGYWHAYDRFYQWNNILRGAMTKETAGALRHLAYTGGWKKFEWLWHALIRMKQVTRGLPLLERALDLGGHHQDQRVQPLTTNKKTTLHQPTLPSPDASAASGTKKPPRIHEVA